MAKNVYAVRKGWQTGLFYSWNTCEQAVKGYGGAEFQGFNTDEEALAYLKGNVTAVDTKTGNREIIYKPTSPDEVNLYTDGSFRDGEVSFGICIESAEKIWKFYGTVHCPEYSSIRNIAGELFAVMVAVQLANDMGFRKLNVFYDQLGVECWYNGSWMAKGRLQGIYVTLMNQLRISNGLSYSFKHVKAHSGVDGNVYADKMAKRALTFRHYVDMNTILRGILTVRDVPLF